MKVADARLATLRLDRKPLNTCWLFHAITPFYHIRAQERAKYSAVLNCRTGKNMYGRKVELENDRSERSKFCFGPFFTPRLLFEKLPPEILVSHNISKNGLVCDVFAFRVR